MDKLQSHKIVKDTFQNQFNKDRFVFFISNLLNHYNKATFVYRGNFIPDAYEKYISTLERVGKYTDGEHKVDILIVNLKKETSIERARTMQRNFVAWYLNGSRGNEMKDAALVAFVSPNQEDWRFSLVKMDYKFEEGKSGNMKVKEDFTPARRWSFLVGKNENSHTAQSRLAPLVEDDKNNLTLKQLEDAFNIEKVTKEFFEKYRELFLWVKDTIEEVINKDAKIRNNFETQGVNIIDFAKKLLGQIVFLYFLQKKGWFGVERDSNWGTGPKNFLRQLFETKHGKYKNFFNDILEPLFYEALARERADDFYSRFNCKIPFLNGGLFDPINNYDWVHTDLILPNDLFSNELKTKQGDIGTGILDIFDRYNFTVKEDEPLEKEVAVDPEMLGKVFENLLEVKDRKSKGTYYTPREIVHYMCQQSLINYLITELENKVDKEDIEKLIKFGDSVAENEARVGNKGEETQKYSYKLPASIRKNAALIDDKLASIKVCDPAIGSGAFPVGMMNEIVQARNTLNAYLCDNGNLQCKNRTPYDFKFECIQNSIYGVDIDPGAVEIAKLRLWLSLVVDEDDIKQIKPLPNLDYKIMQGNSLLEEYEGIKLFDENIIPQDDQDKEKQINSAQKKIADLQREYFRLHSGNQLSSSQKIILEKQIKEQQKLINLLTRKTKIGSAVNLFEQYDRAKIKWDELKNLHKLIVSECNKEKKDNMLKRANQLEWEFIEETLKVEGKPEALEKIEQFKNSNIKPFFLWKLHFPEIFQEKGGFDVIIGNPPYISALQNSRDDKSFHEAYRKNYPLAKGAFDIYAIFLIKGIELTNCDGSFSWIVPNKLIVALYAEDILKYLKEHGLYSIVSVSDIHVFENVGVYPIITVGNKKSSEFQSYEIRSLNDLRTNNLILRQTVKEHETFGKFGIKISSGATGFQAQQLVKCISENKSTGAIPFVVSGSIDPWVINFGSLRYMNNKYKNAYIVKDKYIAKSKWDFWMSKKIIISGMTKRIEAAYCEEPLALGVGIYGIYDYGKFNPKFLLALLNSKYLSYYLKIKFKEKHLAGGYLAINKSTIEQLPIVDVDIKQQYKYIKIVNEIIDITKSDDYLSNLVQQSKVHELEYQIDQMVYKLYDLTPDEIKTVEL